MAFQLAKFRKIQKSGLNTWWSYVNHSETIKDIQARDYFSSTRDRFAVGDWIFCTGSTGSVILHVDDINPLEMGKPQQ